MRIIDLHIKGFGKFTDRSITFGKGVSIIRGSNEAGKTTLHHFIESMLFGVLAKADGFGHSMQESMQPWKKDASYGGTMRIWQDGSIYRLERDFTRGKESLRIVREPQETPVEDPEAFLEKLLGGVTRTAYRNSVSIGQLSAKTGAALVGELKKYIENVSSTSNPDLSAQKAVDFLKRQKTGMEQKVTENAAREYAASLGRIRQIEGELNRPENENRIPELEQKKEEILQQIRDREQDFLSAVDRVADATGILRENGIESEQDIRKADEACDRLYEAYRTSRQQKRKPLRFVGMAAALLMMGAGVWWFLSGAQPLLAGILLFAAGTVLLGVLLIRLVLASGRFSGAKAELGKFLQQKTGDSTVSEEAVRRFREQNHRFDDLLSERQKDRQQKEGIEAGIADLRKQQFRTQENIQEQYQIRFQVESRLTEENALRDRAAQLRTEIAENARWKEEIDAVGIAIDTIGELSRNLRTRMGTYLNNEASRALSSITNGKYESLDAGSGNDICLVTKDGIVSVNEVSAGTLDQVYLAVRLAAARFIMGGQDRLPLLLDDSFALYDDRRLKEAVRFLAEDYRGQTMIFTCHSREEEALSGSDHVLIEL